MTVNVQIIDNVFADFADANARIRALPFTRRPPSGEIRYRDRIYNIPDDLVEELAQVAGADEVKNCFGIASYAGANHAGDEVNHYDVREHGNRRTMIVYLQGGPGLCFSLLNDDETLAQSIRAQENRGVVFDADTMHRGENMHCDRPKEQARVTVSLYFN